MGWDTHAIVIAFRLIDRLFVDMLLRAHLRTATPLLKKFQDFFSVSRPESAEKMSKIHTGGPWHTTCPGKK
jgi:hypothetical protein